MNQNISEEYALSFLPNRIAQAVRKALPLYKGAISEIRLRSNCSVFITSGDKNISCNISPTDSEMIATVRSLCGNSMYCHSETMKEGYICTDGGLRVGVCGRAVTENGKINAVTDISSVCIRIPHRVPGASDNICSLICRDDFRGMIIYSPPGVGKTTALREICARLSQRPYNKRIAVIDTRFEICSPLGGEMTIDALSGYPRAKGMECALRVLSPQLIVCDEIGPKEDADAIYNCMGAGVPSIVSAHAGSLEELCMKPYIKELLDAGAFTYAVGLERRERSYVLDVSRISANMEKAFV